MLKIGEELVRSAKELMTISATLLEAAMQLQEELNVLAETHANEMFGLRDQLGSVDFNLTLEQAENEQLKKELNQFYKQKKKSVATKRKKHKA